MIARTKNYANWRSRCQIPARLEPPGLRVYSIILSALVSSEFGILRSSRFRGLAIDEQFKFRGLFHRNISRLRAFENFLNMRYRLPETVGEVRAVADQPGRLAL